jgi:hypothetical protein
VYSTSQNTRASMPYMEYSVNGIHDFGLITQDLSRQ